MQFNLLLTSIGIRGYLVEYFQQSFSNSGKIYVTDCSPYAPGLYGADKYFITPRVLEHDYIEQILKICKEHNVKGIVPLIDTELPIFSKNRELFHQNGVEIFVSNLEVIEICFDKFKTCKFLEKHHFPCPKYFRNSAEVKTSLISDQIAFPLIIKESKGSASLGFKIVNSIEELEIYEKFSENPIIIQEFIDGQEYGAEFFADRQGKSIFCSLKQKIKMRAGETDKALSVYDMDSIKFIESVADKLNAFGPVDMDWIESNGRRYIIDINPRFGGGYPMAHAIGANFPAKILTLLKNKPLEKETGPYPNNVAMMKQHQIVIKKFNGL